MIKNKQLLKENIMQILLKAEESIILSSTPIFENSFKMMVKLCLALNLMIDNDDLEGLKNDENESTTTNKVRKRSVNVQ